MQGTLPRALVVVLIAGAVVGGLALAIGGFSPVLMVTLITGVTSVFAAGLLALAGGGLAWPVVRKLAPDDAPAGLVVVTSAALGLWLLSTLMLIVGSAVPGSLRQVVWAPVVFAGLVMAAWHCRHRLTALRLPRNYDGRVLMWALVAVGAAFWIAGATRPPGFVGGPDAYDVVEYHLQVPREYFLAGQISGLQHNCYSYYPLATEMLFLLNMCVHGGPYAGMYAAKATHGLFAVLAVVALYTTLKRDDEARGRFAAVLLATVPFVAYLSWLAMVELAEVCYLVLALLWLREWLRRDRAEAALLVGACLGAACAVKYLSVGLVAGPVLAVMMLFALRSGRRFAYFVLAAVVTLALFSPWLVRNAAATGNPVFPLMTRTFGRAHWSEQAEQRWVAGHRPDKQPPVPRPEGWEMPPTPSRLERLYTNFLRDGRYPAPLLLLAGVGVCVLVAKTGPPDRWGWSLVGVGVAQIAVWTGFTHEMPGRFLVPVLVPVCLLGGDALARLSRVQTSPFSRQTRPSPKGPWGLPVAAALLLGVAVVNLASTYNLYGAVTGRMAVHGIRGEAVLGRFNSDFGIGPDHRLLMVGDAQAFFRPPDTIYATVFDAGRVVELLEGGVPALRERGVTHVLVNWAELRRLSATYGYPEPIGPGVYTWRGGADPPELPLLDRLKAQGLRLHEHYRAAASEEAAARGELRLVASLYLLPGVQPATQPATTTAPAR
jgi:hypothetical protein